MNLKYSLFLSALFLSIFNSVSSQVTYLIDFETDANGDPLSANTVIDDEYAAWGVTFSYREWNNDGNFHDLRIFDTANPTGNDSDLATPGYHDPTNDEASDWTGSMFRDTSNDSNGGAGNVLIIQNDNASVPDDEASGGIVRIDFDRYVKFEAIGILDIDDSGTGRVKTKDSTPGVPGQITVDNFVFGQLGDNSYQEIMNFSDTLINRVIVKFPSSGAITGIKFTDPNVIPEPSTYALIFGGLALGLVFFRRRLTVKSEAESSTPTHS